MTVNVQFRFRCGLPLMAFDNVRLRGSWDEQGRPSNGWTSHPMQRSRDEDGYDVFVARVPIHDGENGTHFRWGIELDRPGIPDLWTNRVERRNSADGIRFSVWSAKRKVAPRGWSAVIAI
ncbi:hypothetical protein OLZ32_03220 [Rhizobium sp. 1AS11]|nr:hypothetical protein [Rhizobium acaciae]MCW1406759.1 hypothetical protein [Rhizobium acaciae]MCW1739417.1 hypothetical protein [Rhizobium acaciae]